MDSIIIDDATVVAENAINESLADKEERELFHLIDSNSLPTIQMSDSYQDPTGSNEEGEQSSDRRTQRLESLHNKLEDLPMDEIVIKEIFGSAMLVVGSGRIVAAAVVGKEGKAGRRCSTTKQGNVNQLTT
ncbi:hypothetical protein Ancab_009913 [Ancistrocladus abbreviatus]